MGGWQQDRFVAKIIRSDRDSGTSDYRYFTGSFWIVQTNKQTSLTTQLLSYIAANAGGGWGEVAYIQQTSPENAVTTVRENDYIRQYDNGVEEGIPVSLSTLRAGAAPLVAKIGSQRDGTGYFFKGKIYKIRIWNKQLTSAEVATL